MSVAVGRIGSALRVGPVAAWLIVATGLVGVAALAAVATRQGMLPTALGLRDAWPGDACGSPLARSCSCSSSWR